MNDRVTTFAARLRELIELDGLTVADIAAAGGVKVSTAKRWLAGMQEPTSMECVLALSDRLRCSAGWLVGHADIAPDEFRVLLFHRSLPEHRKRQFERYVDLMSQGDPRAHELAARFERREITRDELLDEVGRVAQ